MGKKQATQSERAHLQRVKEGVCVCCLVLCAAKMLPAKWVMVGNPDSNGWYLGLLEAHHLLIAGKVRRGHLFTLGLCLWHHRGKEAPPPDGWTHAMLRDRYGPSLMDGSRLFHETYGTDDELLEVQTHFLTPTREPA